MKNNITKKQIQELVLKKGVNKFKEVICEQMQAFDLGEHLRELAEYWCFSNGIDYDKEDNSRNRIFDKQEQKYYPETWYFDTIVDEGSYWSDVFTDLWDHKYVQDAASSILNFKNDSKV